MQSVSVEGLSLHKFQAAAVEVIACQGMAEIAHVYPDLVGAACFQFEFHQAQFMTISF